MTQERRTASASSPHGSEVTEDATHGEASAGVGVAATPPPAAPQVASPPRPSGPPPRPRESTPGIGSDPARRTARPRMALRIPDDEVRRPTATAAVPEPAPSDGGEIAPQRIINIDAPPAGNVPRFRTDPAPPPGGQDAVSEAPSWTPYRADAVPAPVEARDPRREARTEPPARFAEPSRDTGADAFAAVPGDLRDPRPEALREPRIPASVPDTTREPSRPGRTTWVDEIPVTTASVDDMSAVSAPDATVSQPALSDASAPNVIAAHEARMRAADGAPRAASASVSVDANESLEIIETRPVPARAEGPRAAREVRVPPPPSTTPNIADARARLPTEPEGEDVQFDDDPLPPATYVERDSVERLTPIVTDHRAIFERIPGPVVTIPAVTNAKDPMRGVALTLASEELVPDDSPPSVKPPRGQSQPPPIGGGKPITGVMARAVPPVPPARVSSPNLNEHLQGPPSSPSLLGGDRVTSTGLTGERAPASSAADRATGSGAASPPQAYAAAAPGSGPSVQSPAGTSRPSTSGVAAKGQTPAPAPSSPNLLGGTAADKKKARGWWDELFGEDFLRAMTRLTPSQVRKEVDFIEESLAVQKGARILDLGCGFGQQAIEMARRGYQVVGFDLSLAMLARAADEAQDDAQKVNFVQGDMRDLAFEDVFDGVYCWSTSFGFFEEEKNAQVISRIHRALKKGGQFLLDVANRDYVANQTPNLAWFEGDGCVCMDEVTIDWITSRLRVKRTVMLDDGRTKELEYSIRLYSVHELGKILHDHGFRIAEISGRTATPGVFFGPDSPRTLILAEKR